ncbi:hypothetical protein CCFV1_ORF101 [Cotesia congregata filamentous virus 1]|uniref:Uncharacterized protein n=1 Tax=Cotesia congregata filamentous virus 1 TaxID=3064291 RepID=A0ABC8QPV1_9VIRU|nr:hypothetical protein CCFV1_ORF101 [Cotesia congregata filamentous virus 1]
MGFHPRTPAPHPLTYVPYINGGALARDFTLSVVLYLRGESVRSSRRPQSEIKK